MKKNERDRIKRLDKKAMFRRKQAIKVLVEELVVKKKSCADEQEVMDKYINHPYMQRFFEKRLRRSLAEVVALINTGKATRLEEQANNRNRKKMAEIRAMESKRELLGREKFNELSNYRKETDANGVHHKRKKTRREKLKEMKEQEKNRRRQKINE